MGKPVVVERLERPFVVCRGGTHFQTYLEQPWSPEKWKGWKGAPILSLYFGGQGFKPVCFVRTKVQTEISLPTFRFFEGSSVEDFLRDFPWPNTCPYRYFWAEQETEGCFRYAWVAMDQPMLDPESPSLGGLFGWVVGTERDARHFCDGLITDQGSGFHRIHFSAPVNMQHVKHGAPQALLEELLCI